MQLNNLDIIILIVVGISALIALSRGLVKEVLSIIGWVLATAAIIYLMPILTPIAKIYIETGWVAGVITALFVLIIFMIVWILSTSKIIGTIRSSKLSGLDRTLGLFFGIARAFLLVILFYILVSWMIPQEKQSDTLTQSRYFQLAGSFAKPIEDLIPESTLKIIREKAKQAGVEEDNQDDETAAPKKRSSSREADELFEKLAQPQVAKSKKKEAAHIKETFDGYKASERGSLDRLIENTLD